MCVRAVGFRWQDMENNHLRLYFQARLPSATSALLLQPEPQLAGTRSGARGHEGGCCSHFGVSREPCRRAKRVRRAVRAAQVPDARSGSLVYRLDPLAPAADVLAEGDVVTEVDGVPVADDGTVSFRHEERVEFSHLIRCKHIGAPCLRLGARAPAPGAGGGRGGGCFLGTGTHVIQTCRYRLDSWLRHMLALPTPPPRPW
jgi:hypothetical protein